MGDIADEMMPAAAMKAILKGAQTPGTLVPIAVGLDADKNAIVIVSRMGKAKSMKKAFADVAKKKKLNLKTDTQSLFYGYGSTDKGAESIFKLTLNKTPPGGDTFAHKVFVRVKGAGYGKVVLATDSKLENEKDEEDEQLEAQQREVETAQTRLHDDGALKKALGQLLPAVTKVGEANPKLGQALKQLVGVAAEALKQGKVVDAATAISKLKNALDIASNSGAAGKADLVKPRLIWLASRTKAREETAKLRLRLNEHYGPQGIAKAIVARYDSAIDELFSDLDESLADTLDAANEASGDKRNELLLTAKEIIARYETTLGGPRFKALENNPFQPLTLSEMLDKSLKALSTLIK